MNNMYDILDKMKLLESRGSKPDFLDLDKDGNRTEPMKKAAKEVDEAADMDESALQAYLGKKKYGDEGMKALQKAGREGASKEKMAKIRAHHDKMDEAEMEEGNDFTGARLAAIKAGKPTFKVDGKVYRVTGDTSDEKVMEYEFDDKDDFDRRAKAGDTVKTVKGTLTKTDKGVRHERRADDEHDEEDRDDDTPKKKGRPKGTKRAIGAKGPTGRSKLLNKDSIKEGELEEDYDKDEYDEEGEMAMSQARTIEDAAKELQSILDADENLPEWVQKKITLAQSYIDSARDYLKSNRPEGGEEVDVEVTGDEKMVPERKLSEPEMKKREDIVKSMKKSKGDFEKRYGDRGEAVMYATATKMAKKKAEESKDEVEETTTSGSVATAPAEAPKGKKGMVFGKGIYEGELAESFEKKLNMLTEGMSINMNMGEDGQKSITVTATDDDAMKLAQILKLAGMEQAKDYHDACPGCGQSPCGCESLEEADLANSPEPEYADLGATRDYNLSGGLNGPKLQANPNNMADNPLAMKDLGKGPYKTLNLGVVAEEIEQKLETKLLDLYKRIS